MKIQSSLLPGVLVLEPTIFHDARGEFVKTYHKPEFRGLGLDYEVAEEFFSVSKKDVLRGMHFQTPPHDAVKLVYCVRGSVLDVLVDLRKSSPSYQCCKSIDLSAANNLMLLIPSGFAHGFLAREDDTIVVYKASFTYAPDHDTGIRWDSFGFDWPVRSPVISKRDSLLPALADFDSPFA